MPMSLHAQPRYKLEGPAADLIEKRYAPAQPFNACLADGIRRWKDGEHLDLQQAQKAFASLCAQDVSEYQIGAFLLVATPEFLSADEIAGFATVLRRQAARVDVRPGGRAADLGDTCGTGGDTLPTFNVSTTAMFIVAAAGAPIAKHGNRAFTSRCGSADVLEALGVDIGLNASQVRECIERIGVGFMSAPVFHTATRRVQSFRRTLAQELPNDVKLKTVFNVLGPLSNPASATWQLLGVYAPSLMEKLASALGRIGLKRGMVVHGYADDPACAGKGLDEISIAGPTDIAEVKNGGVRKTRITPELLGLPKGAVEDLRGGDAKRNSEILKGILAGDIRGPMRHLAIANAAAGLYLAKSAEGDTCEKSLEAYVREATEALDRGQALRKLEDLVQTTQAIGRRPA